MENYLKLPHSDYQKIRETLDELLLSTDKNNPDYHRILYIGNILFEATHDFETGKPYLHED